MDNARNKLMHSLTDRTEKIQANNDA